MSPGPGPFKNQPGLSCLLAQEEIGKQKAIFPTANQEGADKPHTKTKNSRTQEPETDQAGQLEEGFFADDQCKRGDSQHKRGFWA